MTDELKPCPFCPDGGKPVAFVEPDGYEEHGGNVYRGVVGCKMCGMGIELFRCDNEIPADWWCDAAEESPSGFMSNLINAWNTRYERTCQPVKDDKGYIRCSICGNELYTDYDPVADRVTWEPFCPSCGAKVVDDDQL